MDCFFDFQEIGTPRLEKKSLTDRQQAAHRNRKMLEFEIEIAKCLNLK